MSAVGGTLKNAALTTITGKAKFCSLAEAYKEFTATGDVEKKKIKLTAGHGLVANNIIYVNTSEANTLVEGRFYFVVTAEAENVTVSQTEGGPIEEWTGTVAGAFKFAQVKEIAVKNKSAEANKRNPTTWAAAAKGVIKDTTSKEFKVPGASGAGKIVVTYIVFYEGEAVAAGECLAVNKVATPETFESEQAYTITENVWDDSKTAA